MTELFPESKKAIVQHHLNILGALGKDQKSLMDATFTRPEEYEQKWKSKS